MQSGIQEPYTQAFVKPQECLGLHSSSPTGYNGSGILGRDITYSLRLNLKWLVFFKCSDNSHTPPTCTCIWRRPCSGSPLSPLQRCAGTGSGCIWERRAYNQAPGRSLSQYRCQCDASLAAEGIERKTAVSPSSLNVGHTI